MRLQHTERGARTGGRTHGSRGGDLPSFLPLVPRFQEHRLLVVFVLLS